MGDPGTDVRAYYDRVAARERSRLLDAYRASEALVLRRTMGAILADRAPLSVVCEVGSGPGHYVPWLRSIASRVLCLDVSAVELAVVPVAEGVGVVQADARRLPLACGTFDVVFLLGPYYHLPEPNGRRQMVDEAVRVLAPGGWVVVAGLNRTGVTAKMISQRPVRAWKARGILRQALRGPTALSRNALGDFPPAFLSDPGALRGELAAAGLVDVFVRGSESFTVLAPHLARPMAAFPRLRRALESVLVSSARGRVSLTLSEHLFAFARKPRALS